MTVRTRIRAWQARAHKGFTMLELLVVVAIVTASVAVAVPVCMDRFADAKSSVDEASASGIYALLSADYMQDQKYAVVPDKRELYSKGVVRIGSARFEFSDAVDAEEGLRIDIGTQEAPHEPIVTLKSGGTTYTFPKP